jgi:riboflavin synthase
MFTGLVEAKGFLVRRTQHGRDARLVIRSELDTRDGRDPIVLGESIAIDGVCLTVDALAGLVFEVDASSETLEKTTLGSLAVGATVNLERALPIGGRLGGHIVSGHVDGVGSVVAKKPSGAALEVTFESPAELAKYIAAKGSITINGVSLTVNRVTDSDAGCSFDVMLIPHTRDKTSLDGLEPGARVNLEVDLLARYVARLVEVGRRPHLQKEQEESADARLLERLSASGYR